MAAIANAKLAKAKPDKGKDKAKGKRKEMEEDDDEDELSGGGREEEEDENEESDVDVPGESGGDESPALKRKKLTLDEEEAKLKEVDLQIAAIQAKRRASEEKLAESTAGRLVRIKGGQPVAVTDKDIEDYGSLESAVHGVRVENEPV